MKEINTEMREMVNQGQLYHEVAFRFPQISLREIYNEFLAVYGEEWAKELRSYSHEREYTIKLLEMMDEGLVG
jgi:hypothetical protein